MWTAPACLLPALSAPAADTGAGGSVARLLVVGDVVEHPLHSNVTAHRAAPGCFSAQSVLRVRAALLPLEEELTTRPAAIHSVTATRLRRQL